MRRHVQRAVLLGLVLIMAGQAVCGFSPRTVYTRPFSLNDYWARVAEMVPGFGGAYLEADGRIHVFLVDPSPTRQEELLRALISVFGEALLTDVSGESRRITDQGAVVFHRTTYPMTDLLAMNGRLLHLLERDGLLLLDMEDLLRRNGRILALLAERGSLRRFLGCSIRALEETEFLDLDDDILELFDCVPFLLSADATVLHLVDCPAPGTYPVQVLNCPPFAYVSIRDLREIDRSFFDILRADGALLQLLGGEGILYIDLNERTNRIVIMTEDERTAQMVPLHLQTHGVPRGAVTVEVAPEPVGPPVDDDPLVALVRSWHQSMQARRFQDLPGVDNVIYIADDLTVPFRIEVASPGPLLLIARELRALGIPLSAVFFHERE